MTEKTDAELFAEAADLIERHGHRQLGFGGPEEGFCVAGAVFYALTGLRRDVTRLLPLDPMRERYIALLAHLRDSLPMDFKVQGTQAVSQWNDVPGRTQAEAVALLRRLAHRQLEAS